MFDKRFWTAAAVMCFVLAAGCQSGGKEGGLDLGIGGKKAEPRADAITETELRAFCPPLSLRSGTAYYDVYKSRAEKTPENIVYQAAITEVARNCKYNADGSATMTVAVAGKIVTGPAGSPGKVTMPIRFAVLNGNNLVDSTLRNYTVTIGDTSGATQFIYNDPNFVVPSTARSVQILVGFDRGPEKTQ